MKSESSSASRSKNALGRGLRSLIPSRIEEDVAEEQSVQSAALSYIEIDSIKPCAAQPRQSFHEDSLRELSASIKEHGILQPLVVRRTSYNTYEIVAGERRWRAARGAGLSVVPCVISDIANQDMLKVALVENIQREDLNAIEEAESYQRLHQELGLTHEQIAQSVGKDRSTVANAMRLLKLPENVRRLVVNRKVSMGHARALLALRQADLIEELAAKIADENLSVRHTEKLVSAAVADEASGADKVQRRKTLHIESAQERNVRRRIEAHLGTQVEIHHRNGRGTIALHFSDINQLNDLIDQLTGQDHLR
jgi:ParB family chromosome partitioning protein